MAGRQERVLPRGRPELTSPPAAAILCLEGLQQHSVVGQRLPDHRGVRGRQFRFGLRPIAGSAVAFCATSPRCAATPKPLLRQPPQPAPIDELHGDQLAGWLRITGRSYRVDSGK
jgi:hypothetical protein